VPLVRQTWLCKKKDRYVALRMIAPARAERGEAGGPKKEKRVRFEVVESATEKGLGFHPAGFSKGGNATCPFCGTVADSDYVKAEGRAKRMGEQMMAIVCTRGPGSLPGKPRGKIYLSADDFPEFRPDDEVIRKRTEALCRRTGLTVPSEPIINDAKSANYCVLYGLTTFGDLFTPRQMLCLLTFATAVREAQDQMRKAGMDAEQAKAVGTYLAALVDKITTRSNTLCPWDSKKILTVQCFGRQALPMLWDFSESNPLADASGAFSEAVDGIVRAVASCQSLDYSGNVTRGSATALPWPEAFFDAVVTDPPYYDNVPYADISDFFYVWLKRTIGHLYPEHFATEGTPKKQEAVADAVRYGGSKEKARAAYEQMMAQSFAEANRVLKPGGQMVVVYAHKTTLGWSTLVDALRQAGFTVTEAWPLDTEGYRLRALNSAALASSIFLVARKREGAQTGSYEDEVRPELEKIVRERVDTLWKMGITGADLVIAAVGAGLRAYTRFARVEYANGEEVPAEKFLAEVEGVVLETLLEKIFGMPGSGVAAVDGPSRFYVLWRYAYKAAEMDAGEAIVFTYGQNVELDGQKGLSTGRHALVEKKKGKYRLRDFTERGEDEKLGLPGEQAGSLSHPPLIDALHRILWLVENQPRKLNEFLDEARPDRERLRLVAQALAGRALSGGLDDERNLITTAAEQAALKKLLANWRALIGEGTLFDAPRK
jgi:putative DNA methylase